VCVFVCSVKSRLVGSVFLLLCSLLKHIPWDERETRETGTNSLTEHKKIIKWRDVWNPEYHYPPAREVRDFIDFLVHFFTWIYFLLLMIMMTSLISSYLLCVWLPCSACPSILATCIESGNGGWFLILIWGINTHCLLLLSRSRNSHHLVRPPFVSFWWHQCFVYWPVINLIKKALFFLLDNEFLIEFNKMVFWWFHVLQNLSFSCCINHWICCRS